MKLIKQLVHSLNIYKSPDNPTKAAPCASSQRRTSSAKVAIDYPVRNCDDCRNPALVDPIRCNNGRLGDTVVDDRRALGEGSSRSLPPSPALRSSSRRWSATLPRKVEFHEDVLVYTFNDAIASKTISVKPMVDCDDDEKKEEKESDSSSVMPPPERHALARCLNGVQRHDGGRVYSDRSDEKPLAGLPEKPRWNQIASSSNGAASKTTKTK